MDNGMPMTPAEYEVHYNNELERDKKRDEQWNKMKISCKNNINMQEQLASMLDIERQQRMKL